MLLLYADNYKQDDDDDDEEDDRDHNNSRIVRVFFHVTTHLAESPNLSRVVPLAHWAMKTEIYEEKSLVVKFIDI